MVVIDAGMNRQLPILILAFMCLLSAYPASSIYIRYAGCNAYATAPNSQRLEDNSPERCFQSCHPATQMVALHEDECVCEDKIVPMTTVHPRSTLTCDGDSHVFCGCVDVRRRNAGWSVYEKTDIVVDEDRDSGCVAASHSGTTIHLVTKPCNTSLVPLCYNALYYACTKGTETVWSDSCLNKGLGYLVVNQYSNLVSCDFSSNLYWTGFLQVDDTAAITTTTITTVRTTTESTTTTHSPATSATMEYTVSTSTLSAISITSPEIRTTHRITKTNSSVPRKRPSFSKTSTRLRNRPIAYGGGKNKAVKNINEIEKGSLTSSTTLRGHSDVSTTITKPTAAILSVEVGANTLQEDLKRYVIVAAVLVIVLVGLIVGIVFCIAMRKQRKMLKSLSTSPNTLTGIQQDLQNQSQSQDTANDLSSESDLDTNVFTIPHPSFRDLQQSSSRPFPAAPSVFATAVRHDTSSYNDVTTNLDQSRHSKYSSPYRSYSNRYLGIYNSRGFSRRLEHNHMDRRCQHDNDTYMLGHDGRNHVIREEEPKWVTLVNQIQ